MLKAIVSYSKKIPVPDSESASRAPSWTPSQGYSLSLEIEIPDTDPAAIQARLHETFELVKSSVEHELANGNGHAAKPAEPAGTRAGGAGSDKASNKQIKFITDLATQRGMSLSDLNGDVQKRYDVAGLYDLSRKQASALLDELNGRKKAA